MVTPKSVADFKSLILRPSLSSYYQIDVPVPAKMTEKGGTNKPSFLEYNGLSMNSVQLDNLRLLCCEATLPGSSLATLEINNDFHGVTQRHAYRRIYDDRIDLTFYVDAENYLPIRFFETWMKFIVDESIGSQSDKGDIGSLDPSYFYRIRYPSDYVTQGLKVIKFEKDYKRTLEYEFVSSFPISISSIPISYESSSLLKCTVSMNYIRYVLKEGKSDPIDSENQGLTPEQQALLNTNPLQQYNFSQNYTPISETQFNIGGVPDISANLSGNAVK